MWRWAIKSLITEPVALAISVLATACAFLLVMFFEAVYVGESDQVVAYVANADADLWVMQRGVSNMHMASSYLAADKVRQIREVPGVASAEGILYLNTVISAERYQWFAYVVGLDVPSTLAGPWAMVAGQPDPGSGEAVVPSVLARQAGLTLGDRIRVVDRDFRIVGLADGTFSMANSIIFIPRVDLEDLMSSLDIISYVVVKVDVGTDVRELAARIEDRIEKVTALEADRFVSNDRQLAMQMGVETIALMTVIGGALAALLVAFTVYSLVARQRRELAAAKALGASGRQVLSSVMLQAVLITFAGVVLATLLAAVIMPLVTTVVPQIQLRLSVPVVGHAALLGLGVALLAAWWPARQLARLDPISAFHT